MTKNVQQLAKNFFEEAHTRFPEISYIETIPAPSVQNRYWILVDGTMTASRNRAMERFVADKSTDLLIDKGYSFSIKFKKYFSV